MESLLDNQTALVVINNPSNPCGSVFSRQHIQDIMAIAENYKVPILGDEIYAHFVSANSNVTLPWLPASTFLKKHIKTQPVLKFHHLSTGRSELSVAYVARQPRRRVCFQIVFRYWLLHNYKEILKVYVGRARDTTYKHIILSYAHYYIFKTFYE